MRMRRYPRALVGSVFVALLGGCPPAETPAPVAPSSPSPPAAAPGPSAAARGPAPPATDKRPVTDTHHGVAVTDDYRWPVLRPTPRLNGGIGPLLEPTVVVRDRNAG
ncbi:MAG: hypothetical protein AAF928_18995, partial [Myxococcota bacterium]